MATTTFPALKLNNGVEMPALGLGAFQSSPEAIDGLDTGHRGGREPDDITLQAFGRDIPEV